MIRKGRRPVLFVRPGALGDILCTFPAALELEKRHPGAVFIYSCLPDYACLPKMAGVADRTTPVGFAPESRWRFCFEAVYHFSYGTERSKAATGSFIGEFCQQHGLPTASAYCRLNIDGTALAKVKAILERHAISADDPLILLHPGPSWPIKEWPARNWSALVKVLRAQGYQNIVQLGVGKHPQMGALSGIEIPGVVPLVDQISVEETVALVSIAKLLIGIDSGLMHIAASVNTPAVGIFGPTSPQYLYPPNQEFRFVVSRVECQGCHHRMPRLHWMTGCLHDVQCMKEISVEDVLKVVLSRLSNSESVSRK